MASTLLHMAAAEGMEEVAWRLIGLGADVHVRDSAGRTPLDEARRRCARPAMPPWPSWPSSSRVGAARGLTVDTAWLGGRGRHAIGAFLLGAEAEARRKAALLAPPEHP